MEWVKINVQYFHFMSMCIFDSLSLMFFLSSFRKVLVGSLLVVVKLLLLLKSITFMILLLINYNRVAFISFCYHSSCPCFFYFDLKSSLLFYLRPYCANCFTHRIVWNVVLYYSRFGTSRGPVQMRAIEWVLFQPLGLGV